MHGFAFVKPGCSSTSSIDLETCDSNNNVIKSPPLPTPFTKTPYNSSCMDKFVSRKETKKAEILSTLHTICSYHSYKYNTEIDKLFSVMFPDSEMVKIFKCGEKNSVPFHQFIMIILSETLVFLIINECFELNE